MCDAYIYVPQSLTMMHVCMMHISMTLDLDPDACMYDVCPILIHVTMMLICMMHCMIHVCMVHVCMMRQILFRTDERTDKAILGV